MALVINNTDITRVEQLPDNLQTLLQMIPLADKCASTIVADVSRRHQFASGDEFVEALLVGLRGTTILYLSAIGLLVAVEKLMALSPNDMRDLYRSNRRDALFNNARAAGELAQLLAKNKLIDTRSLELLELFYRRRNIAHQPLIWGASFADQLKLYDTLVSCEKHYGDDQGQCQLAVEWALLRAETPAEFADYYHIKRLSLVGDRQTSRTESAAFYGCDEVPSLDEIVDALNSVVLGNLDCPVVSHELDRHALNRVIRQWGEQSKTLGFCDFSSGLLAITLNVERSRMESPEAQARQYTARLQRELSQHLAGDSYVNQAGSHRCYPFALDTGSVVLGVDAQGCLSIIAVGPAADVGAENG